MKYIFSNKRQFWQLSIFIFILFALVVAVESKAAAAQIKWKNSPYTHYSAQEDIKDVLTDFFAFQRIGVVFSEDVKGTVSGNFENKSAEEFFNRITKAYNLIWYYDGSAVYVYSAHEMTSKILNFRYLDMQQFKKNLNNLGFFDQKFTVRIISKDRIIYVSGPKRYVDIISHLAEQLDEKAWAMRGENDKVEIFALKYAWAQDKTFIFRDKEMTVPGVASILRDLISGNTAPNEVQTNRPRQLNSNLYKLKGKGLVLQKGNKKSEVVPEDISDDRQNNFESDRYPPVFDHKNDIGVVKADLRQNAVVVRDREEKMPYYKQIIESLDVPVGLVEIKATIMDIDRDSVNELGVEWEFTKTSGGGDNVYKVGANTTEPFSHEAGLQLPVQNSLSLATVIGDAANYFLAKVHALEEKGHAKILSRPSVLTMNNIEAQLEHSQTFYVRLEGKEEVDLYDIDTGVVLKVTPHIIEEESNIFVKLAIQIEDGELTNERVDDIPVVKKSVINTQAVVNQDESLLLGGYLKESNINRVQTTPCLGEIPLLRWLFTTVNKSGEKVERLFMITPTIKPYSNEMGTSNQKIDQDLDSSKSQKLN
jgi:type III secretion protein C